jgi:molybdate transport system substrate-binding protein
MDGYSEEESVKRMRCLCPAIFVLALVCGSWNSARAQGEITLLAVGPMRAPTQKIVANFEAKTGYKVKVTYGNGADTRRMVAKGQTLDVNLMAYPFPGALASGTIDPNSATTVTSILTAVGVPKGRPHPDISTPAAVKKALLAARVLAMRTPTSPPPARDLGRC